MLKKKSRRTVLVKSTTKRPSTGVKPTETEVARAIACNWFTAASLSRERFERIQIDNAFYDGARQEHFVSVRVYSPQLDIDSAIDEATP
jgi:hypothetical protein